ncbi:hypothetical protein DFH09DRAFT_1069893 [Mycena vulgaris]|nr:hypothetical protein DFH09DRAFT_1069893 [Mycena vulgaris]
MSSTPMTDYSLEDSDVTEPTFEIVQPWSRPELVSLKEWPKAGCTVTDVMRFMREQSSLDMSNAKFGVHFSKPHPQTRDSTVYTAAPDFDVEVYRPFILGVALSPVVTDNDYPVQTFRIGYPEHQILHDLFSRLLLRFSSIMEQDDVKDYETSNPAMRRFCDAPAFKNEGGSFINVDVSYQGHQRTEFITTEGTCSVYKASEHHPIAVGDLVLFQATIHQSEMFIGTHKREYFLRATRLKVLELGPDSPKSPITTILSSTASSPAAYPATPLSNTSCNITNITEGTGADAPPVSQYRGSLYSVEQQAIESDLFSGDLSELSNDEGDEKFSSNELGHSVRTQATTASPIQAGSVEGSALDEHITPTVTPSRSDEPSSLRRPRLGRVIQYNTTASSFIPTPPPSRKRRSRWTVKTPAL